MEKQEIIKKLRIYMDECNGEGSWKPYIGSLLEGSVANFILSEILCKTDEERYAFECKVCGKPFGSNLDLYEHYDQTHNHQH